jgi:hypothetical protein
MATAAAAAAAGIEGELAALRTSRQQYQAAVIEQEGVRNGLLATLGETLRVSGAV